MQNEQINAVYDAAKLAPGGAYMGLTVCGVSLPDIVTILTGVYLVGQILLLIPKYVEVYKKWRSKRG